MKAKVLKFTIIGALFFASGGSSHAQGAFVNLDFEHPILPLVRDSEFKVPTADALPGWTAYIGGNQIDRIVYNTVSLGAAAVSLQTTDGFYPPIQGLYSVGLQANFPSGIVSAEIAQIGQIPASAKSLVFLASAGSIFRVSFGGQQVPVVQLGATSDHITLAGDISPFAGEVGELRFSGGIFLDAISFSSQVVPEPSVIAFSALGMLLLGKRWCWAKVPKRRQ